MAYEVIYDGANSYINAVEYSSEDPDVYLTMGTAKTVLLSYLTIELARLEQTKHKIAAITVETVG